MSTESERKDVVVVFVHGINTRCQDYYIPMRDRLLKALPEKDRPYAIFRAVFWADILRGRQQEYLLYADTLKNFKVTGLHKLVIEGLGDAAAYQKSDFKSSAYGEIQKRVRKTISDASQGHEDKRPVIFIGHSLGCHIISSYAWDLHKLKHEGKVVDASPFERLDTFAGFVTMGSNQPLFTFHIGPQHVQPITKTDIKEGKPAFPGPELEDNVQRQARWLNFYSSNDPLGYPLKPLNEDYDGEALLSDIHTCSEGHLRRLLLPGMLRQFCAVPAHGGYWTNGKVVRQTAQLIGDIINADARAAPQSKWSKILTRFPGRTA